MIRPCSVNTIKYFQRLATFALLIAPSCFASQTNSQAVGQVVVESGTAPNYYAKTLDNNGIWIISDTTCSKTVHYLWIQPSTNAAKEMLSLLLTAKSTRQKVTASGACGTGTNTDYYIVTNLSLD